MPLTRMLPWILTAIAASIATMVSGVHAGLPWLSWAAVLVFAAALVATSIEINRPWWQMDPAALPPDIAVAVALRNARLMILAYAWGALALGSVYRLSGLRWQHGMQYAAAMLLMAMLILAYVHLVAQPASFLRRARWLGVATQVAALHGAAAAVGIGFLVGSGKLRSIKGDWAANQIFLAGGLAIVLLTAIAVFTQQRLVRSMRAPAEPAVGAGSG